VWHKRWWRRPSRSSRSSRRARSRRRSAWVVCWRSSRRRPAARADAGAALGGRRRIASGRRCVRSLRNVPRLTQLRRAQLQRPRAPPCVACCRRIADETPRHSPSRLSTTQHRARAEPWTVQHLCARGTTARHALVMFPKPVTAEASGSHRFCRRSCAYLRRLLLLQGGGLSRRCWHPRLHDSCYHLESRSIDGRVSSTKRTPQAMRRPAWGATS
jgi:hypothetical protein